MRRPRVGVAAALVRLAPLCGGLAILVGCGGRPAVDVRYPEANRAALASVPPRRVVVAPVTDLRSDTARIGSRPKDGAPIVTTRPVTDIVRDALALEIGANGHTVVSDAGDVTITAAVESFWLDALRTYPGTQYVGRVALTISLRGDSPGDPLLTRRYVGLARRTAEETSDNDWRDVMDLALSRAMHDLATDPDLVSALGHLQQGGRAQQTTT